MRAGLVLPVPNFLIATATEGAAQSASVFPAGQACWRRSVEDRFITQVVQARPRPHSAAPHRAKHSSAPGFWGGGRRREQSAGHCGKRCPPNPPSYEILGCCQGVKTILLTDGQRIPLA
ncbi:hypothetical protein QQF64_034736 [Cirrhinus molitorella]|uniref:Secreted protein n=1 Tax=Cirrhinus molitorella TaxID=172907 RepID=A0ABR3L3J4_9TELE